MRHGAVRHRGEPSRKIVCSDGRLASKPLNIGGKCGARLAAGLASLSVNLCPTTTIRDPPRTLLSRRHPPSGYPICVKSSTPSPECESASKGWCRNTTLNLLQPYLTAAFTALPIRRRCVDDLPITRYSPRRSGRHMNAREGVSREHLTTMGYTIGCEINMPVTSATFSNSPSCAPSPARIERLASHGITHRVMMDARTVGILNGAMRRHGARLMKNYTLVLRLCRNAALPLLSGR